MRICLLGIYYPLAMLSYFREALEQRDDVELWTCGPFTGSWIPWNNGMNLPEKYVKPPDYALPQGAIHLPIPSMVFANSLPWEPDLTLMVDAGWHPITRPPGKVVALVKTDPHALSPEYYAPAKAFSDIIFGMQTPYLQSGERYLPYAFSPRIHYPMDLSKEYDACLIGLQYQQRFTLVNALRKAGVSVYSEIGKVYDEYREIYNRSRVALSWSSLQDTPTRVYEAFGMGLPLVSNRTPDLCSQYVEGDHFLGFDSVGEAVEKVKWALSHPEEAQEMANAAHRKAMASSTWDLRIQQIFEVCGLNKKVFA